MTEERIQNILVKYNLSSYVDSCKGMTLQEFEKHTIERIREFENEILSCTKEDAEALKKYEKELSQIRVFFNKALNYVKTKDAKARLFDGEQELLDRLYNNVLGNIIRKV